jgi:hypothetical protein
VELSSGYCTRLELASRPRPTTLLALVWQVALSALDFWQDTYLATLSGLPLAGRCAAVSSHTPLLQASERACVCVCGKSGRVGDRWGYCAQCFD